MRGPGRNGMYQQLWSVVALGRSVELSGLVGKSTIFAGAGVRIHCPESSFPESLPET